MKMGQTALAKTELKTLDIDRLSVKRLCFARAKIPFRDEVIFRLLFSASWKPLLLVSLGFQTMVFCLFERLEKTIPASGRGTIFFFSEFYVIL